MKHKTADLTGDDLDLAVMLAAGWRPTPVTPADDYACNATWKLSHPSLTGPACISSHCWACQPQAFSSEWEHGGPIIEREQIWLSHIPASDDDADFWAARVGEEMPNPEADWMMRRYAEGYGPTPLIAAMRAYIVLKLGHEITLAQPP